MDNSQSLFELKINIVIPPDPHLLKEINKQNENNSSKIKKTLMFILETPRCPNELANMTYEVPEEHIQGIMQQCYALSVEISKIKIIIPLKQSC